MNKAVETWHSILESRDVTRLSELIADDAVFHSPIVHTPQKGKDLVILYLTGAFHVLSSDSFQYVREVVADNEAVLEFECDVDGIHVNGVDLIRSNDAGQIVDFKVLIRPLKAVNKLHEKMGQMLEELAPNKAAS